MSNPFDFMTRSTLGMLEQVNKRMDRDFAEEQEQRRLVAKGIISDSNELAFGNARNAMTNEISGIMADIDWGDRDSIAASRDKIFGDAGAIAAARSSFMQNYTDIPDAPNPGKTTGQLWFDSQEGVAADNFLEKEQRD